MQSARKMGGTAKYDKLTGYFGQGKAKVWLVFDGNSLAGYAQFFQKEDGRVHLNEIAVSAYSQGKGIGSKLLRAVEDSAAEAGAECVELFCSEKNEIAKDFYEKHAYQTERRLLTKNISKLF